MIHTYLFTPQGVREDVPLDDWRSLVADECALLWVDVRDYDEAELDRLPRSSACTRRAGIVPRPLPQAAPLRVRGPLLRQHDHRQHSAAARNEVKPSELHVFVGPKYIITVSRETESPPWTRRWRS